MGPTWGPRGSCRPQNGPMLAPWILLSGQRCTCWWTMGNFSHVWHSVQRNHQTRLSAPLRMGFVRWRMEISVEGTWTTIWPNKQIEWWNKRICYRHHISAIVFSFVDVSKMLRLQKKQSQNRSVHESTNRHSSGHTIDHYWRLYEDVYVFHVQVGDYLRWKSSIRI